MICNVEYHNIKSNDVKHIYNVGHHEIFIKSILRKVLSINSANIMSVNHYQ